MKKEPERQAADDLFFSDFVPKADVEDFEDWIRAYPRQAERLRQLHTDWSEGLRLLESARTTRGLLQAGQKLGQFVLIRRLGKGAQAEVWEARQDRIGRHVALKVMENAGARERGRFEREAQALARVEHTGVVRLIDIGEAEGITWIAQELVPEGRTLRDVFLKDRHGDESNWPRRVAGMVEQVALAMAAAHGADVIHRDLKPSNIFVTADGSIRVGDFGLARLTEYPTMTSVGDAVGTFPYMSPEQISGSTSTVGPRSDIFSLGVVLFELLAGRLPFDGDTPAAVCGQILHARPPRTIFPPGTPSALIGICMRALEKDVHARYQSMPDFAADLSAWREGRRPRELWRQRVRGWRRSIRSRSALFAGATLALVAGAAWFTRMGQGQGAAALALYNTGAERYAWVSTPHSKSFVCSTFTVECWCKPLGSGFGHNDDHLGVGLCGVGASSRGQCMVAFSLIWRPVDGRVAGMICTNRPDAGELLVSQSVISPGDPCHVAMTVDENQMVLYVNGVVEDRRNLSPGEQVEFVDTDSFAIGAGNLYPGFERRFEGIIDEVRYWRRARSGREIRETLKTRVPDDAPDLIAQWTFDRGLVEDALGSAIAAATDSHAFVEEFVVLENAGQ